VAVVEAEEVAHGGSGRNGGFAMTLLDMSLTHLAQNHGEDGARRAHEAVAESVRTIGEVCRDHDIECDYHHGGLLVVATNDGQRLRLADDLETAARLGLSGFRALTGSEVQALVHSPTYLEAYLEDACATVHPARLARGLKRVVASLGVKLFEHCPVVELEGRRDAVILRTPAGEIRADRVVVGTNAWASRLHAFRRKVVPLYTYVLLTEPLTEDQWDAVGWAGRQGIEDKRNYVHYYRVTGDGRILWGGRDGIIYRDLGIQPSYDRNDAVFDELEATFRHTFPQLGAVGFSHRWGGPVAITVPFVPYYGTLQGGRVHYGFGYNGHGVAPAHTGGRILSDLVLDRQRGYTDLPFVHLEESSFPAGKLVTWAGAELSRRALLRQDERMDAGRTSGRMDPWMLRWMRKLG